MNWTRRRSKSYRTTPVRNRLLPQLNSTQARVPGFDLAALQQATVVLVGAGGIGSPVAAMLARKGVGHLILIDHDVIELPNLTRQAYSAADVGKYKVHALANSIATTGLFPTRIDAHPFNFQECLERGLSFDNAALIVAGVDNNPSRRAVCAYGLDHNIPVIHAAVGRGGNECYTMIQEPRKACWGCAFDHYVTDDSYPCQLPGIIDVLAVVAGAIVFSVDTIVSNRPREWNTREFFLDGSLPDRARRFTENESVRLTNFFIRTMWKTGALASTIIARLSSAIVLASLEAKRRNRRLP
jgi:adenylyltransferase/sulfurtransferase